MAVRFVKPIDTPYESQFVPMPLDFMYQAMQEKQKGLDLTREAKGKAALDLKGAPFAEDQGYVLSLKQEFNTKVDELGKRLEQDKENYRSVLSDLTKLNKDYTVNPLVNKIKQQKEEWDANIAPAIAKYGAKNVWIPGAEQLNPETNQWEWRNTEEIELADLKKGVIVDNHIKYIDDNFSSKLKESVKQVAGPDAKVEIVEVTDPTTGATVKQLKTTSQGITTVTDLNLDNDFTVGAIDKAADLILTSQDNDSEYIKRRLWNPYKKDKSGNVVGGWGFDNKEDVKRLVEQSAGLGFYKKTQVTGATESYKNLPDQSTSSSSTGTGLTPSGLQLASVEPYKYTEVPVVGLKGVDQNIALMNNSLAANRNNRFTTAMQTISKVGSEDIKKQAAKSLILSNPTMPEDIKNNALKYIDSGTVTIEELMSDPKLSGYLAGIDKDKGIANMDIYMNDYRDALGTMTKEQIAADPEYDQKLVLVNDYFNAKSEDAMLKSQLGSYSAIREKIYEGVSKELDKTYEKDVATYNKKYGTNLTANELVALKDGGEAAIREITPQFEEFYNPVTKVGEKRETDKFKELRNLTNRYTKDFNTKADQFKVEETVQGLFTSTTPGEKDYLGQSNKFLLEKMTAAVPSVTSLGVAVGVDVTDRDGADISKEIIDRYSVQKSNNFPDAGLSFQNTKLKNVQMSWDPKSTVPTMLLFYEGTVNDKGKTSSAEVVLNVPMSLYGNTKGTAQIAKQALPAMITNPNPEVQTMGYQMYARMEMEPQELDLMYSLQNSSIDNASVKVDIAGEKFLFKKVTEGEGKYKVTKFLLEDAKDPSKKFFIKEGNVTGAISMLGTIALNRKYMQAAGAQGGGPEKKSQGSPLQIGTTWVSK